MPRSTIFVLRLLVAADGDRCIAGRICLLEAGPSFLKEAWCSHDPCRTPKTEIERESKEDHAHMLTLRTR